MHVYARFNIFSVGIGGRKIADNEAQRFDRIGVGKGCRRRRCKRFDCMRENVHTGVCRNVRRHTSGQCRIQNCNIGNHIGRYDRVFDVIVRVGDNRKSRNFAGSTACRRNADKPCLVAQGRHRAGFYDVFKSNIRVFVKAPHNLCRIQCGTAADCYNPVRAEVFHLFAAFKDGFNRRIRLHSVDNDRFDSGFFKQLYRFVKKAEFFHGTAAGNDSGFFAF